MLSRNLKTACCVLASAGLTMVPVGCKKPPPVTLSAEAAPPAVFQGEPVSVTATPGSVDPNKKTHLVYSWTGTGVTGKDNKASVDTSALAPGSYTVKAEVKEGKPGKEGVKPGQTADASASFTVKEFEPPTISCAVDPASIKPGDSAAVKATAVSPQNRPLTYAYTASAGSINGNGASATYDSTGAATGAVGITCKVSDDKGHTASADTSLTIVKPYIPPAPHSQSLGAVSFGDKKRPTRVDNEAKANLDDVALGLQKSPDAKVYLVGESDSKEKEKVAKEQKAAAKKKHAKPVIDPAAERAVNVKDYLVKEKGIDPSRIIVVTGTTDGTKVEEYLVPAGATFTKDVQGTTPVDETVVKPQARKPLAAKHHAKKAAK